MLNQVECSLSNNAFSLSLSLSPLSHDGRTSTTAAAGGERRRPSATSLKRRRPLVDEVIEVQWRRNTSLHDPLDDDHNNGNNDSTSSSVSVSLNAPTATTSKPTSSSLSSTTSPLSSTSATRETKPIDIHARSTAPAIFPSAIEGAAFSILLAAATAIFVSTLSYILLCLIFPLTQ